MKRFLGLMLSLPLLANPSWARTWVVEADGSGDAPTIHAAILMAAPGDIIDVGPGTYHESVYLTGGQDILLRGRNGAAETILDGGGLQMDAGTAEGFTIRNAGGVFIGQANTITNPVLRNNVIEHNSGRGVWNSGYGARIESNFIHHNDGGWKSAGGGIRSDGGEAIIANNVVAFNRAQYGGGGMLVGGDATVFGNVVVGNEGGGVYLEGCIAFRNNTVYGNRGGFSGVEAWGCLVEANVIVRNQGYGLIGSDYTTVRCNDIWGNGSDVIFGPSDPSNFSLDPLFCAADPVASLNFSLRSNSPCAPGLSPSGPCSLIGAAPVGCGTVAIANQTWGGFKQLFR